MSLPLSGYVLAGGKSRRMGTDKALLLFDGMTLIERAVQTLDPICRHVAILGDRPDLSSYADTLPDLVPDAGPLGGIASALQHTQQEWLLIVPVDVPLLSYVPLREWAWATIHDAVAPAARCFAVEERAQPLVALLHRELAPFVAAAVQAGERKVLPVLEAAASKAAENPGGSRRCGLRIDPLDVVVRYLDLRLPALNSAVRDLWFANANTSAELVRIEARLTEAVNSLPWRNRKDLIQK